VAVMALMAMLGTGSASATVLCEERKVPCPGTKDYNAETEIQATLEAGTWAILQNTAGTTLAMCEGSELKGETGTTGGKGKAVTGNIEALTFEGCANLVVTIAHGLFAIHYLGPKTTGELTFSATGVTAIVAGVSCVYGTGTETAIGLMQSDESISYAEIDVEAVLTKKEGSFLCPGSAVWTAKYLITKPQKIYFKEE
jgi:hypothetical protein